MEQILISKTSLLELLKGREIQVGDNLVVRGYGLDRRFEYFGKIDNGCQVDANGNDLPKGNPEIHSAYKKARENGYPVESEAV